MNDRKVVSTRIRRFEGVPPVEWLIHVTGAAGLYRAHLVDGPGRQTLVGHGHEVVPGGVAEGGECLVGDGRVLSDGRDASDDSGSSRAHVRAVVGEDARKVSERSGAHAAPLGRRHVGPVHLSIAADYGRSARSERRRRGYVRAHVPDEEAHLARRPAEECSTLSDRALHACQIEPVVKAPDDGGPFPPRQRVRDKSGVVDLERVEVVLSPGAEQVFDAALREVERERSALGCLSHAQLLAGHEDEHRHDDQQEHESHDDDRYREPSDPAHLSILHGTHLSSEA